MAGTLGGTGSTVTGAGRFVGRVTELSRFERVLDDALAAAPGAAPTFVEVTGEPGIGRSRLLAEMAVRTTARGLPAYVPQAHESAAADGVVLVDDLHLAGLDGARPLLEGFTAPAPEAPPVLVVAYRPRQAPAWLGELLSRAGVARRIRLDLAGLSPAETAELAPEGADAALLHRISGGLPGYVVALAATDLTAADLICPAGAPELPLALDPHTDAVRPLAAELAGLSADETSFLQAAAVLGDPFDPDLLVAVAGLAPARCVTVLDALAARDLIRPVASFEPELRFRHRVVRSVAYQLIPPGLRRTLHASIAGELHRRGLPSARRADHLARSAEFGDMSAVRALVDAAHRVAEEAPERAVSWLTAARRLVPAHEPPPAILPGPVSPAGPASPAGPVELVHPSPVELDHLIQAIDVDLASISVRTGHLREGQDLLFRSASAPGPHHLRHILTQATASRLIGDHVEAGALIVAELSSAGATTDPLTVLMLSLEGAIASVFRGSTEAHTYAARAREALASVDDVRYVAVVRIVEAFVAAHFGGLTHALPGLVEAATLVDGFPDRHLVHLLDPIGLLGWTELLAEHVHESVRHFDRALHVAGRSGQAYITPYLLAGRAHALSRLGRLDAAARSAEEADTIAMSLGSPSMVCLARSLRAAVIAQLSGPAAAVPLAESAVAAAPPRERDWFAEIGERMLARIRFEAGERTGATDAMVRAMGGPEAPWVDAGNRPYWASQLAVMLAQEGDVDGAAAWTATADRHARELGLAGQTANVLIATAQLRLRSGAPGEAPGLASDAVTAFAELGWPVDEALARLVLAHTLAASHSWQAAEEQFAEVHHIAETVGSDALRHGLLAGRRTVSGWAGRAEARADADLPAPRSHGFTRREQAIADLVAGGLANSDIARKLCVSPRTVEAHLTRMYRKAGVRSRGELTALLIGTTPERA